MKGNIMHSAVERRSYGGRLEFTNKLTCKTCGDVFYIDRYYDEPEYCGQACFWYDPDRE